MTDSRRPAPDSQAANASAATPPPSPSASDLERIPQLLQEGLLACQDEHWERAIKCFRTVLRRDPTHIDGLNLLGSVYGAQGFFEEAETVLRQAIAQKSDVPHPHFNLGLVYHRSGRPDLALPALEQALALDEDSADAWVALGDVNSTLEQPAAAETAYRRAIALHPQHPIACNNLSTLLAEEGRIEEAIHLLSQAEALNPDYIDAAVNRIAMIRDVKGLPAALEACQAALEARAHDSETLFVLLGNLHHSAKDWQAAISAYDQALHLEPGNIKAMIGRGYALEKLGRDREAGQEYRRAVYADQENALAAFRYGVFLARRGKKYHGQAREHLAHCLALDPRDPHGASLHLASLTGEAPLRVPSAYLATAFDLFSDHFDHHLLDRLAYQVPTLFADLLGRLDGLTEAAPGEPGLAVLDFGCGTGLAGEALRPFARHLEGVDVAPRMVREARARQTETGTPLFDRVVLGDGEHHLELHPERYDLIAAADVAIYLGALEPLLQRLHRALRPGGRALLNVEHLQEPAAPEIVLTSEGGWGLTPAHRFAHSPAYLHAAAAASGLAVIAMEPAVLRFESEEPVAGLILCLQRPLA